MSGDLEKIHRSIYKHMKAKALAYEGGKSKTLKTYQKDQTKFSKRKIQKSSFEDLNKSISESQLVFLGDFHTFDQNSRNLERITRMLLKGRRKFSLGVEMVMQNHQHHIDDFLSGNITEIEFLELIDYHESWRFPWSYYRPFFEMAKKYKLKVLALNTLGNLKQRDDQASALINDFFKGSPKGRLLVLFGELHIVPDKLPALVQKKSKTKIPATIIHQNLDEVYWKLGIHDIEENNQVVKFNKNEFSLQTSPPWIKYESMIYWYENLCEDPEFDIHDYIMNNALFTINTNVTETFHFLCEKIIKALKLPVDQEDLEDFNLYDHSKLKFVLERIERIPRSSVSNFYKKMVEDGKSFRIPYGTYYYCSSYSINRISFLSGMHIQDIQLKKKSIHYERVLVQGSQLEKFLFLVRQTTFGYLTSKIVNPYRKCDLYLDFRQKYMSAKSDREKDSYKLTLELIEWDGTTDLSDLIQGKSLFNLYYLARRIGFYMGDLFYDNFLIKNKSGTKKILNFLTDPHLNEDGYHYIKSKIISPKKYRKHKKRLF